MNHFIRLSTTAETLFSSILVEMRMKYFFDKGRSDYRQLEAIESMWDSSNEYTHKTYTGITQWSFLRSFLVRGHLLFWRQELKVCSANPKTGPFSSSIGVDNSYSHYLFQVKLIFIEVGLAWARQKANVKRALLLPAKFQRPLEYASYSNKLEEYLRLQKSIFFSGNSSGTKQTLRYIMIFYSLL